MEYSPLPREESERSGVGRDCPLARIVAQMQGGYLIRDLDQEAFEKAIQDNKQAEEAGDIWE